MNEEELIGEAIEDICYVNGTNIDELEITYENGQWLDYEISIYGIDENDVDKTIYECKLYFDKYKNRRRKKIIEDLL